MDEGKNRAVRVNTQPKGDSGLNEFAFNTNRSVEHLLELQGRNGSLKYRQMSRGDPQVGMILKAHKNPLMSANWSIPTPDDAEETEIKAIEVLNDWMFESCCTPFHTYLGQILSFIEYGFCIFEKYWELRMYQNNKYYMPILEQRVQTSIEDIFPKERTVRQNTIDKGTVDLDFDDLVFFIVNQQGEDMRGESFIRTAYPSWKDKSTLRVKMHIGLSRNASGVPKGTVPKGINPDDENYIAFEALLKNMTIHEDAYMILVEGYDFEIIKSDFDPEKYQKLIDGIDQKMALSVLAQFMLLGQAGRGGAYALSRDQSDFFLDGLQYVIGLIERTYHKEVIIPFLKINFGDKIDPTRIKLKGTNLNKKAGKELSEVLSTLKGAGFIKSTMDDEVQLRKFLEMPELSEEERERRKDLIDNPPVPPVNNPINNNVTDPIPNKPVKLAEQKEIRKRQQFIDKNVTDMVDFMKSNLLTVKSKLVAEIEKTMKRGTTEIQGLKKIEISNASYQSKLEKKLAGIAMGSWLHAKNKAKTNNIKLAEDMNPADLPNKNLNQFVRNQASSVSEQQITALKARAILTASNGPLKGLSMPATISNVSRVIDEYIDSNGVTVSSSLVVVGSSNFGEMEFNNGIKEQLWGYRFVNADPVSEICQWYNGKTFSVDSPELSEAVAPLHPNCKSYMEPIYNTEEKPKKIDDVIAPPSVRKQKSIY